LRGSPRWRTSAFAGIKSIPAVPRFQKVLIPDEPELFSKAARLRDGIPGAEDTWEGIAAIARKNGIDHNKAMAE
jgi:LDH2 family malate/lactate/ureidoglycolate dehydrogenase